MKCEELQEQAQALLSSLPSARIYQDGAFHPRSIDDLSTILSGKFHEDLQAATVRLGLKGVPVVGVCGTINAGKSSLVSGFLSESNSKRVLASDDSTDRFTFWLPGGTAEAAGLEDPLIGSLRKLLDCEPELLAPDPQKARAQQNAQAEESKLSQLARPLIAFDPALSENGIAFLDCPDIQKSADESIEENTADLRLDALRRFSRACSGFIIVTTAEGLKTERFGEFFKLIEKTGRDLPVYLAYNKLARGFDRNKTLASLDEVIGRWGQKDRVRELFGADHDPSNPPRPEFTDLRTPGRPLGVEIAGLNKSALYQTVRESALGELTDTLATLRSELEDSAAKGRGTVAAVHTAMSRYLSRYFIDDNGNLRPVVTSPKAAKDLLESFARTAPDFFVRQALWIASPIHALNEAIAGGVAWAGQMAQEGLNGILGLFGIPRLPSLFTQSPGSGGGQSLDPRKFSDAMKNERFHRPEIAPGVYETVLKSAVKCVSERHFDTGLDEKKLDTCTKRVWKRVPFFNRLIFAAALPVMLVSVVVAALGIVVIDPTGVGGSLIVANLLEILSGSAIAYLITSEGMLALQKQMEKDLALPQLGDLHAVLCDLMDTPRDREAELSSRKAKFIIDPGASRIPPPAPLLKLLEPPLIEVDHDAFVAVLVGLENLKKEVSA